MWSLKSKYGSRLDQGSYHYQKLKTIGLIVVLCCIDYLRPKGLVTTMHAQKGIFRACFF